VRKEIEEDNENSAKNDALTRNYSSSKAFFAMKDKEALERQEAEKEAAENEKWDAMLANAVDEDGRRAVLAAREQAKEAAKLDAAEGGGAKRRGSTAGGGGRRRSSVGGLNMNADGTVQGRPSAPELIPYKRDSGSMDMGTAPPPPDRKLSAEKPTKRELAARGRSESEDEDEIVRKRKAAFEKKKAEKRAELQAALAVKQEAAAAKTAEKERAKAERVAAIKALEDNQKMKEAIAKEEAEARQEAEAEAGPEAEEAAQKASAAIRVIYEQQTMNEELAIMDPKSPHWHGYSLLESDLGGCYLAMNFEADAAPLPVRSMRLDPDGIPVKGMLWKHMPDGSLENLSTGLVLQTVDDSTSRKATMVCDDRDVNPDGSLGATCKWTFHDDGTIENASNHLLLTVSGGSTQTRTPVWLNARLPKILGVGGVTKAHRWKFKPYHGEPKDPLYPVKPAFKAKFKTPEQRAAKRAAEVASKDAEVAAAAAREEAITVKYAEKLADKQRARRQHANKPGWPRPRPRPSRTP